MPSIRPLRPGAVLGALLAGALAVPLLQSPAATAADPSYVALGDSYSSGTGTRDYIDDGTTCRRSVHAYPSLVAAARGYALDLRACSGATVPDVAARQLGALGAGTSYVTVSVGGNDAGFADVLTECAMPWWAADCHAAIDEAQAFIDHQLPGLLSTLYAEIRADAPVAEVVVVGYPRIFMGEDCNAGTWFSPREQERLNRTADQLNDRTSAVAADHGFAFADPTDRFVGHAVCDDPEWINGLSSPVEESYHPNKPGHSSGYTPVVSGELTGSSVTVTRAVVRRSVASGPQQAELQRDHAATDAAIEPESVHVPDLTSPQVRRAARREGIDLDRWLARH
jgi:lysophospholipase L1-like esterase